MKLGTEKHICLKWVLFHNGFSVSSLLSSFFLCLFVIFYYCCSHVRVLGKTLMNEFHNSAGNWMALVFFWPATTSAQCVFVVKKCIWNSQMNFVKFIFLDFNAIMPNALPLHIASAVSDIDQLGPIQKHQAGTTQDKCGFLTTTGGCSCGKFPSHNLAFFKNCYSPLKMHRDILKLWLKHIHT